MKELEFLAIIAQDYISKQDRCVQIALAEKAQNCVNAIEKMIAIASSPAHVEPVNNDTE
jgi:hypothetical protein